MPAHEIIHLTAIDHHILPYGIPRWVAQTPSVVGSRKAEEFNLGFFDAGGVPPMMIVVEGGEIADKVEDALKNLYFSKGQHKHLAVVLNVQATSGALDKPGNAGVRVERFGNERQKDGMFLEYDKISGNKIRRAWRLPPLFVGDTQDYTLATALASYRVAEAQVFKPEREEFDDMVNTLLLPALVGKDAALVRFRSLPVTVNDMTEQLSALGIAINNQLVDREEAVSNLNEISGLTMTPSLQPPTGGGLPSSVVESEKPPEQPAGFGAEGAPEDTGIEVVPGKGKTKKREQDSFEASVETAIDILRKQETGTARIFDTINWMRQIDSEKRDLFGRRVASALFNVSAGEMDGAAAMVGGLIEASAEG